MATLPRSFHAGRTTTVRRWTQAAIECHERGCRCAGCYYNDFFAGSPHKCQMKYTVLELVRTLGRPSLEEEQEMIIN